MSIAATILMPKGRTRLAHCPPRGAFPTPPEMRINLAETSPHPIPPSEDDKVQDTGENPQPTSDGPNPSKGAARPKLSAQRTPTGKSSPLLMPLSRRDLLYRLSKAKRTHSVRIRTNKRQQHESMIPNHWPDLRPASLPVSHRKPAPTPPTGSHISTPTDPA